jgi:hypothetical protein
MADIEIAQIESETKKFDSIQETIQKGFEFKSSENQAPLMKGIATRLCINCCNRNSGW